MSNNLMFIENKRLNVRVYVAKYYPSTGWYPINDTIPEELSAGFDVDPTKTMSGPTDWVVGYDSTESKQT